MVRFCKYIILLTSYIFLLSSCQEGGEAGDLFGQWRMSNTDSKYISFSGSLTLFRDTNIGTEKGMIYGKFQHVGDSLFIECISIKERASDTAVIEESFGFKPFDNIRLKIDKLDSDDLILSQDGQTWSFYKY